MRFEQVRGRGDAEVARLAELQHGHLHLHQLRAAGIRRGALVHRVRTGRLHVTFPHVYLVGRPYRDVPGRMMAAALHFRGDGLVAARAAAQLWGMLDATQQLGDADPIDVLLLGRNAAAFPGVRIRRTSRLARQDVRWRRGIPVTSPALTLLGLAAVMDGLELEAALLTALRRRLVSASRIRDVMAHHPYARGIATLRSLLAQSESLHDTRSEYERKLLKLLRAAELPLPITNTWVGREFVDGLWPDIKLVLEFDGWRYHGGRAGFEADRLRDQRLAIVAHRVIRVTGRQIDHAPHALVARIASLITALRLSAAGELPPVSRQT